LQQQLVEVVEERLGLSQMLVQMDPMVDRVVERAVKEELEVQVVKDQMEVPL
jgi:hypothetical protein